MFRKVEISLVLVSIFVSCLGVPTPSKPSLLGRIVGGKDASIEDYPYQVSLEYKESHLCGGSIISNDWVVTAAHCIIDFSPSEVRFRAGTSIKEEGGSLHPAENIIPHPNFTDDPITDFDIAVVKVSIPFTYGPGVQAISMVTQEPQAGEMGTITGWGAVNIAEDRYATVLQVAFVPIVDRNVCNNAFMLMGGITDEMMCAGFDEGGTDACQDDSGGPLVVGGKLAGIISFGASCAVAHFPGIYANVAVLRDFVVKQTGVE